MGRFTAREWQNCATCQYWVGPRQLNQSLSAAEVDPAARGTCIFHQKCAHRYATTSCINWQVWGVLRPAGTPAPKPLA